jgi:hypothetical protein
VVGTESTTVLDHVQYTTWGSDNDVDAFLKDSDIFTDDGTSNTSMTLPLTRVMKGWYLDVQVISEGDDDLLDLLSEFSGGGKNQSLTLSDSVVDLLKDTDGEGSGFSGSRLSLGNDIVVFKNRHDSPLLNGRRSLKT